MFKAVELFSHNVTKCYRRYNDQLALKIELHE